MTNEPLKAKRFIQVIEFEAKKDWATFIKEIADEHYFTAKKITLVMDNFKTPTASVLYETFELEEAKRPWDRLEFKYTPKYGKPASTLPLLLGRPVWYLFHAPQYN